MLSKLAIAFALMALCVAIHAIGVIAVFRRMRERESQGARDFWRPTSILIRIASWVVFLHLVQIVVWAIFYAWRGAMPDFTTAAYFSAVTYTTTGYGDLVLPAEWRLVGGVEALTGILMCGLSTGMFFAIFSILFDLGHEREREGTS
jgi:voltage-gated potassium channel Kch